MDAPRAEGWSDSEWRGPSLSEAVIYELHTGAFTEAGTFEGIIEKLPHLLALGVNCLELMPVAEFAGERGLGYDGVDLYAPHHACGGPEGLRRLVDACHFRASPTRGLDRPAGRDQFQPRTAELDLSLR